MKTFPNLWSHSSFMLSYIPTTTFLLYMWIMGSQPAFSRDFLDFFQLILGWSLWSLLPLHVALIYFSNLFFLHVAHTAFCMLLLVKLFGNKYLLRFCWVETWPFLTYLSFLNTFYTLFQCANSIPTYYLYELQGLLLPVFIPQSFPQCPIFIWK